MNVVLPDDIESKLVSSLREGLADDLGSLSALMVLSAAPWLAQPEEIQRLLEAVLHRAPYGYRVMAAKVLGRLDNPLGPVHLAYNSVRFHPVLKEDHFKISGHDYTTVGVARRLGAECVDLLVQDAIGGGLSHAMTLPQRTPQEIFALLRPGLQIDEHAARNVAYIRALMGDASVLPNLEQWLYADPHPSAAIVEISHIENAPAASVLRKVTREWQHKRASNVVLRRYFEEATHRLAVMSGEKTCTEVLREYAKPEISVIRLINGVGPNAHTKLTLKRPIRAFSRNPVLAPYPPNLIYEFASAAERAALAAEQRDAVQSILEQIDDLSVLRNCSQCEFMAPLPPTGRDDDRYYRMDGFYIDYDVGDYLRAATIWIEAPEYFVETNESMTRQRRKGKDD